MRKWIPFFLLVTILMVSIPFDSEGRSPVFSTSNDSLASSLFIGNPAESCAFYNHLEKDSAHYYHFELQNQRLFMQILVPVPAGNSGFLPDLVLMIPDWTGGSPLPSYVELAPGYGYEVIKATLPVAVDYEGVTAMAFYVIINFDEISDELYEGRGEFYVVIYDSHGEAGNYAFVLGHDESSTAIEFLLAPFSLINIYLWQGSGPLSLIIPIFEDGGGGLRVACFARIYSEIARCTCEIIY